MKRSAQGHEVQHRNLRFHEHDLAEPSSNVQDLLDEIDQDPTAILWG